MIKLNGYVCIDGKDMYFEDFEIEIEEELELPFDFLTDDEEDYCDCDCDCDDCEFCDDNEDDYDRQANFNDSLDELLDDYTELFMESCLCPECTRALLLEFLDEFVDI